jgi:hypothetical protein
MVTVEMKRFKTWRVMACMAIFNVLTVALIGAYFWEQRSDRLETEAAVAEWHATALYAPTELTVHIGPTMETTRIVEGPLFEGPRVLSDFPGRWITRLRHVATDALVCTMPQTGPREAGYTRQAPMHFAATWVDYTNDDGRCFAQMRAGEEYDLTTVREAFVIIDGERHQRFLDPVQSAPFTFVGPQ